MKRENNDLKLYCDVPLYILYVFLQIQRKKKALLEQKHQRQGTAWSLQLLLVHWLLPLSTTIHHPLPPALLHPLLLILLHLLLPGSVSPPEEQLLLLQVAPPGAGQGQEEALQLLIQVVNSLLPANLS
jgi:hypothetical protein